jgi:nucleoside-diphosphate-sugar epimerase
MQAQKMKAFVTGIHGFTGRYVMEDLQRRGYDVFGLARANPTGSPKVFTADLGDEPALTAIIAEVQPDVVVHLAAIAFVAHGDVQAMYRTNVAGSRCLMAALAATSKPPRAVLVASSANVYGNASVGIIDESVTPAPANDYAVSKLAMEYMAALWQPKLPIIIARPFNYTGVGQSPDFLLPKIVSHFRRRAPVLELGNLDVERDFSDVRTVARCYGELLGLTEPRGVYNVCSGQGHTLRGVLDLVAELSGHVPDIKINPAFLRDSEVKTLIGSKAALEAAIGPVTPIPLRETLQWMLHAQA